MRQAPTQPADPGKEDDPFPQVERPRSGLSALAIAGIAAGCAVLLFVVIESRRTAHQEERSLFDTKGQVQLQAPAPLVLPPAEPLTVIAQRDDEKSEAKSPSVPLRQVSPPPAPPQVYYPPPPAYVPPPAPAFSVATGAAPRNAPGATTIVYDVSPVEPQSAAAGSASSASGGAEPSLLRGRAKASRLRNGKTTIAQGALIRAILETALDTTRPGLVRAVVSEDVYSFDGSRILIARGSRLIGQYGGQISIGQKRVGVIWSRLVRPDGAMIELESPATDTLGRSGVKGRVNTHFFARFGNAFLQTILDIGVNVASSRLADGTVIYGIPGTLGNAARAGLQTDQVAQPTIKVRQGTSVNVLVARDLDFTAVEN